VPIKDAEERRQYQREWIAQRRSEWFSDKFCIRCGSTEDLRLDHIDPRQKVEHRIWSWSRARRDVELAKCQVLCHPCHVVKTVEDLLIIQGVVAYRHGSPSMYAEGCRCGLCRLWRKKYYHEVEKPRKANQQGAGAGC
jgi:hypothetical protein